MKTKSDWKQQFNDQVKWTHIKYDWDGGHCYSTIVHPLIDELDEEFFNEDDCDELMDWSNDWLYENDECPPCEIGVNVDGSVGSRCGCHDSIDHTTDDGKEEIEGIIIELENFDHKKDGL